MHKDDLSDHEWCAVNKAQRICATGRWFVVYVCDVVVSWLLPFCCCVRVSAWAHNKINTHAHPPPIRARVSRMQMRPESLVSGGLRFTWSAAETPSAFLMQGRANLTSIAPHAVPHSIASQRSASHRIEQTNQQLNVKYNLSARWKTNTDSREQNVYTHSEWCYPNSHSLDGVHMWIFTLCAASISVTGEWRQCLIQYEFAVTIGSERSAFAFIQPNIQCWIMKRNGYQQMWVCPPRTSSRRTAPLVHIFSKTFTFDVCSLCLFVCCVTICWIRVCFARATSANDTVGMVRVVCVVFWTNSLRLASLA